MFSVSIQLERILPKVRYFKHRKNCHIPRGLPSSPLLDFFSPNTKFESPDLKKHLTLGKVLLMPTGFKTQPSPTLKEIFSLYIPVSFILEVICTAAEA